MDSVKSAAVISVKHDSLKDDPKDLDPQSVFESVLNGEIKLSRTLTLDNDVDAIAREVVKASSQFTYVLVTVEDVQSCAEAYRGIANAFSEELVANNYISYVIHTCSKNGFSESSISKMSVVPASCEAHNVIDIYGNISFPIVSIRNVFIFMKFAAYSSEHVLMLLGTLLQKQSSWLSKKLFLDTRNYGDVIKAVKKCITQFEDKVRFQVSHISCDHPYQLTLLISGVSDEILNQAEAYLRFSFCSNIIINSVHLKSRESLSAFSELLHSDKIACQISEYLSESVGIVETCIDKYKPGTICLSFNGGKDCTALLHIISCVLLKKHCPEKLKVFYVRGKNSFPEIEEFVQQCVERYDLELLCFDYPIKDALANLKERNPEVEAILMGTRSTDPRAADLKIFQMTDSNWPQFMRVNPLLRWGYNHVWQFLRMLNVPYCCLYDQGYTSLGCQNNTVPNPKLKSVTPKGEEFFCPAYLLEEPSREREGRSSSS